MLVDDLDAAREPLEGDGAEDDRVAAWLVMKLYMKAKILFLIWARMKPYYKEAKLLATHSGYK